MYLDKNFLTICFLCCRFTSFSKLPPAVTAGGFTYCFLSAPPPLPLSPLLCAWRDYRCQMNGKREQGRAGGGSQARECHAGCRASQWDVSALCKCGNCMESCCSLCIFCCIESPGLSAALLPAVTTQSVKSSPFLLKMS